MNDSRFNSIWNHALIMTLISIFIVSLNGAVLFYFRNNVHVKGRNGNFMVVWYLSVLTTSVVSLFYAGFNFLHIGRNCMSLEKINGFLYGFQCMVVM
eukprot:Pgem_evm1s5532